MPVKPALYLAFFLHFARANFTRHFFCLRPKFRDIMGIQQNHGSSSLGLATNVLPSLSRNY